MSAIFLMAPASEWWGKLKSAIQDEGLQWFECPDGASFTTLFNHHRSGLLIFCPTERLQLAQHANVIRSNRAHIQAGKLKTVIIVPPSLLSGQFRAPELVKLGFNEVIPANSSDSYAAHKITALFASFSLPPTAPETPPVSAEVASTQDPLEKMKERMRRTAEKLKNLISPEHLEASLKKMDQLAKEQRNNAEAYDKKLKEQYAIDPLKFNWDQKKSTEPLHWALPFSFYCSELVQKKSIEKIISKSMDWSTTELQHFAYHFCRRLTLFFKIEQCELWAYQNETQTWVFLANSQGIEAKPTFQGQMNANAEPTYLNDRSAYVPVVDVQFGRFQGALIFKGEPVQTIDLSLLSQVAQFSRAIVFGASN